MSGHQTFTTGQYLDGVRVGGRNDGDSELGATIGRTIERFSFKEWTSPSNTSRFNVPMTMTMPSAEQPGDADPE
jgi:hypothetical protein